MRTNNPHPKKRYQTLRVLTMKITFSFFISTILQEHEARFSQTLKNKLRTVSTIKKLRINKRKRINFKPKKKLNSVLIQSNEVLVIFQYLLVNFSWFQIINWCCTLRRQLRKFLAVIKIKKNSLLCFCSYFDEAANKAFTLAGRAFGIKRFF